MYIKKSRRLRILGGMTKSYPNLIKILSKLKEDLDSEYLTGNDFSSKIIGEIESLKKYVNETEINEKVNLLAKLTNIAEELTNKNNDEVIDLINSKYANSLRKILHIKAPKSNTKPSNTDSNNFIDKSDDNTDKNTSGNIIGNIIDKSDDNTDKNTSGNTKDKPDGNINNTSNNSNDKSSSNYNEKKDIFKNLTDNMIKYNPLELNKKFDKKLEEILSGSQNENLRAVIKPLAYTTIATLLTKGGLNLISKSPSNLTRKDYDKIRDSYINLVYRTDVLLKRHKDKNI